MSDFSPFTDLADSLKKGAACKNHEPLRRSLSCEDAENWWQLIQLCSSEMRHQHERWFALNDLYFLLVYILNRPDVKRDWCFNRCNEVMEQRENTLDFWSRGSWKSTISTFGLNIQDILRNPNETIGIFSHTRPAAKKFLRTIMVEFETNEHLKALFPDVLYKNPRRETKWALEIDTPVLTVTGWKRHIDLIPGDKVFGADGSPITVIGNSGPVIRECQQMILDDCDFVASNDHLWPVQHRPRADLPWPDSPPIEIFTTDNLPIKTKRHRLLATPVVELPDVRLPLDPYILGLWLGDGTAGTNIISMHRDDEPEVLAQIADAGFLTYIHRRKPEDNFSMYGVTGLREQIDKLGCLTRKHVPQQYLFAHSDARRALLQGLMDSDGTCKKAGPSRCNGMCMFSNTNADLAQAVFFLAASLGMRPSHLTFMPEPPGRLEVHHIYFVGVKSAAPFRLSRKLELCKQKRHKNGRYVRKIEPASYRWVNCIKVDAPDGIYLAGKCLVPTHNSEDDGIVVKRTTNRGEATVEAWGLVDGQPTGKHFTIMDWDDVIPDYPSEDMIPKITEKWELSLALTARPLRFRVKGTFYDISDTYQVMMQREFGKVRIRCAVTAPDCPFTPEEMASLRNATSPRMWALQYLLDVDAAAREEHVGFDVEWPRYYGESPPIRSMNIYIVVDPAGKSKESNSQFALWVVGLLPPKNIYVLDGILDKLDLGERGRAVVAMHRKYYELGAPPLKVGYESYAMQGDIDYIRELMQREHYIFPLIQLSGTGKSKDERIELLIPDFRAHQIWFPSKGIQYKQKAGADVDIVKAFIEREYRQWPFGRQKDLLDALARIKDPALGVIWPRRWGSQSTTTGDPWGAGAQTSGDGGSWLSS